VIERDPLLGGEGEEAVALGLKIVDEQHLGNAQQLAQLVPVDHPACVRVIGSGRQDRVG
jgi:hypothetical protein